MSKDGFILHEWQKDKFDALVKYNEIEDAKKEGRAEGKAEGTKEKTIQIARNLLNMKMSIEDISKATGLTEDEIKKLSKNKNDTEN